MAAALNLGFGFRFADLYEHAGLARLDERFVDALGEADPALRARLLAARSDPQALTPKEASALLLALAPQVDGFVTALFGIGNAVDALRGDQAGFGPLFECKRKFVQRRVAKDYNAEAAAAFDGPALRARLEAWLGGELTETALAAKVLDALADEAAHAAELKTAAEYCAWAMLTPQGRHAHPRSVLFRRTGKRDPLALVPVRVERCGSVDGLKLADPHELRERDGFDLTDPGATRLQAMAEIDYCIYCHNQGRDSCSIGVRAKDGSFQKNAIGATQTGCPLGEKISEMHLAKSQGWVLSALGIVCVDNPMAAGTGHRICNDCMVACIYTNQNRDPVDVPQAETRTLKDVLELPWGFEIYSLFTRWNPFDLCRPLPRPATGRNVLVAGMGPAGYTLAHHLINDGHAVVAIDGLKIEPLPPALSGVRADGARVEFAPVHDVAAIWERGGERTNAGFGGVAEYGITARWDKNFLKVLRMLLERRAQFAMYGGVRLGSTVTIESAFASGFDHVALCMGAGKPTLLGIPNGLARGVRQASDFLMALQLTGAARRDSVANLQLRLPVVVVGGGLTAIDTCTEALAYYPVQVERFLSRHETLCAELGEDAVRRGWSEEERETADEFIVHARALRAERAAAKTERRAPRVLALLQSWGGAAVAYRRTMVESPAYRNHEEIAKAFEEGITFHERLTPVAVEVDRFGHAAALRVRDAGGAESVLPARAVLVAAGTVPNTVLAREHGGFEIDGKYFQAYDEAGERVTPERLTKPTTPQVLARIDGDGRAISFFGDLHPSFAGNVVSAMASAKQGYPTLTRMLERAPRRAAAAGTDAPSAAAPGTGTNAQADAEVQARRVALFARLDRELRARVLEVNRLASNIVEVVVHAPAAAAAFRPGQFFRLQNYEAHARRNRATMLAMEGIALTGAWVDAAQGKVAVIALEMGGSSNLCRDLKPGEPVVLMGPTGEPTHIPRGETVLLAGGGLGNAVLFSIGQAMRAAGNTVLYFAGYRRPEDHFKMDEIEAAADVVVWCTDVAPTPAARRPVDRVFVGNIVQAMAAYAEGRLGDATIPLRAVNRVIAIGSDRMMAAVAAARHRELAPHFDPAHVAIASVNSPMQCMMKEVCAQCLQLHRDPKTGEERVVFTCFNQDQPIDSLVFPVLRDRLAQNSVSEKLTAGWIAACAGG